MDIACTSGIAQSLSSGLSRFSCRTALRAGGAGLATALLSDIGRGAALDATPATPDPLSDDATFLFVQMATGGTFAANPAAGTPSAAGTPVAGGGADHLLTLTGHTGNTLYFSDRPERIFGEAPTQQFLDGLGFPADNPPNAALVTQDEIVNEDILVVELFGPSFDATAGTVSYGVNILSDYEGDGLAHIAGQQQDEDLAPTFGQASLFIVDCPDANPLNCYAQCYADAVGNLGNGACAGVGATSTVSHAVAASTARRRSATRTSRPTTGAASLTTAHVVQCRVHLNLRC